MAGLLIAAYAVCSAILGWRLVTVVTTSTDPKQRADALRMFGYIWGSGTLGIGLVLAIIHAYQSGMLT